MPPSAPATPADVTASLVLPPALAVEWDSASGSTELYSGPCLLIGWAFLVPSPATAGTGWLLDNRADSGKIVAGLGMSSSAPSSAGPGLPGVRCDIGVYGHYDSGTFKGSVWLVPL